MSPLLTIFRSNAYNTGDNDVGLFPKTARINHSCRPNSGNWWSEKRGKRVIYAARDIEMGEEITISYIPLLKTREERQARLVQYGFECGCDACMASRVSPESDERRTKISSLLDELELELYPRERTGKMNKKLLDKALLLVEYVEEEKLTDYIARCYHLAAVFSERRKKWEDARDWAEKELEVSRLAGEDSKEVLAALEFIDGLEQ